MKTYILLIVICIIVNQFTSAQITNTFPLNDSVGIGTTTPTELFQVNGTIKISSRRLTAVDLIYGASSYTNNISGIINYGIGDHVLEFNTSGSRNVAFGENVLQANTIGSNNIAIGHDCMLFNVGGSYNTSIGDGANRIAGIGNHNTAIGAYALAGCFKGSYNTAIGDNNMGNTDKGNYNTSLGALAMTNNLKGSNNTIIGYDAETSTSNLNNTTALGNGALVDANNKVRIGNASVSSNGGQVEWTAYSDARIKAKVKDNVPGLEFINLLKPVTYHFDVDKQNELMGMRNAEQVEGMYDIEKIQWTGFIAQDVDAAAKKINYDFSGVDNSGEILGLRYSSFVVPMVKAIQELSVENEKLKIENEELKMNDKELENRIAKIEKRIAKNKFNIAGTESENVQQIKLSDEEQAASLSQNIPNPFTGKTNISFYIPETAQAAQIKFVNANGASVFIADVKLGNGVLEIDATQLSAGTYSYTLIVDGKVIDTKLMVIAR